MIGSGEFNYSIVIRAFKLFQLFSTLRANNRACPINLLITNLQILEKIAAADLLLNTLQKHSSAHSHYIFVFTFFLPFFNIPPFVLSRLSGRANPFPSVPIY